MRELPEVERVAAFGAVAQPLKMEVPRFSQSRRQRIEVLHECVDLDLAVWLTGLSDLKRLKNAMSRGLSFLLDTHYRGVAHHQVDVHILDAVTGDYRGRLCGFWQCPKPGKRECHVRGCGAGAAVPAAIRRFSLESGTIRGGSQGHSIRQSHRIPRRAASNLSQAGQDYPARLPATGYFDDHDVPF